MEQERIMALVEFVEQKARRVLRRPVQLEPDASRKLLDNRDVLAE